MRLEQLPVPPALRTRLMRRHRAALLRNTRTVLRGEVLDGPRSRANLNVHFTPVARDGAPESVVMMFEITSRTVPATAAKRGEGKAPPQELNQPRLPFLGICYQP